MTRRAVRPEQLPEGTARLFLKRGRMAARQIRPSRNSGEHQAANRRGRNDCRGGFLLPFEGENGKIGAQIGTQKWRNHG